MAFKVTHTEPTKGRPKLDAEALMLKVYYEAPKALNNQQLADFLCIHIDSFCELQKNNSEFSEALKHYKRISPIEVLHSFKRLAVGYSADDVTKELKKEGKEMKLVVTKIVTKHFQPNAAAATFYLKNQMPEEFKDKAEVVHSAGSDMENITIIIKGRDKS